MKIYCVENKSDYIISEPKRGGENRFVCPVCSSERKKQNVKDLSWNVDKETGYCQHCNVSFVLFKEFKEPQFIVPVWKNKTELSDKVVAWFEKRGISQSTLKKMKISDGLEWMPQKSKEVNTIQFNYFKGEKYINTKFRDSEKNFKLIKDAELIWYNYNAIENEKIIICEGEMDCLSFIECGFENCISVPNGASAKNMSYFNIDDFEDKTILLATDNDEKGIDLKNELSRRIGAENCFKIDFSDCKDANEYLIKYGKPQLVKIIENAKPLPIEGIVLVEDFEKDLDNLYVNGLQEGKKILHNNLNELITWETSRLCIVTGIPGMGKSEVLDEIIENLNIIHGWKAGYFSPENFPLELHSSKIISKLTGKKFNSECLSDNEYAMAKYHMNNNFYFIKPENEKYTLDNILDRAAGLVKRNGVKIIVVDPWNRLEHLKPSGVSDTMYISECLTKIINFTQKYNVLFFLVAHPRKIGKTPSGLYEVPTLYDISGSATFFDKTDYGVTVYRNYEEEFVSVYVQKVKFKHLGSIGCADFKYNINNGRLNQFNKEMLSHNEWDNRNHILEMYN